LNADGHGKPDKQTNPYATRVKPRRMGPGCAESVKAASQPVQTPLKETHLYWFA
jgi:hypothetical protein